MKNLIILLCVFSLFFTACSDILEEEPKTFISSVNFYKSEADFNAALMGLYVDVRNIGLQKNLQEVFADYSDFPESAEQTGDIWQNNPSANFWPIRQNWSYPYAIINNANLVLAGLENIELEAAVEAGIEAEAKCLRAYAYFQLVQLYGDIPLRTEPVRSLDEIQKEKSSQNDIYDLIINDLIFAESNLPDDAVDEGRVYKSAATGLLAKVYLTTAGYPLNITANYSLAKTKAVEVITSDKFQLLGDYAQVFHNNRYTSETIWEALVSPPNVGNPLHQNTAPTGNQTATMLPTEAFINSFAIGDRRMEWGIKDGYTNAKGNEIVSRTYYNKFIDEQFFEDELSPAETSSTLDYTIPILRLAEMYLIAAEAENEMNGPAAAYEYINKVRERARIDNADPLNVPDLSGLSQEDFRDAVLMERKWELHLEGSAWFDLKRTQSFDLVQAARGTELVVPIGPYNNTWLIPDFEISNNNIDQNPSYGGN
ncbi:RagB/SusD family nutrient uptake outer membrane protein [Arenibacter echinorum]|uniref:Putative outer membrane starch-binding protein n=1 Tax=Arenibacter echinorum TaxID=440515 RepID=A0A327QUP9_9FLAO|nr:RagB/SusD family nutrient uptake outer membrane protein [Arenibacter echinorum]RAJ08001.1 putative outer membrane starch-binding protein [Arenibacter echinorum]